MKKIFTMLFAVVATVSIAAAQSRDFDHSGNSNGYSKKGSQQEMQQFSRNNDSKFSPYQMNSHFNAFEQSRQDRKLQDDCYEQNSHGKGRFEKSHSRFMAKKFSKKYANNRW